MFGKERENVKGWITMNTIEEADLRLKKLNATKHLKKNKLQLQNCFKN
jgi:hypothetical protein